MKICVTKSLISHNLRVVLLNAINVAAVVLPKTDNFRTIQPISTTSSMPLRNSFISRMTEDKSYQYFLNCHPNFRFVIRKPNKKAKKKKILEHLSILQKNNK